MSSLSPYDFELVIFKFEKLYFTTGALFKRLVNMSYKEHVFFTNNISSTIRVKQVDHLRRSELSITRKTRENNW